MSMDYQEFHFSQITNTLYNISHSNYINQITNQPTIKNERTNYNIKQELINTYKK